MKLKEVSKFVFSSTVVRAGSDFNKLFFFVRKIKY